MARVRCRRGFRVSAIALVAVLVAACASESASPSASEVASTIESTSVASTSPASTTTSVVDTTAAPTTSEFPATTTTIIPGSGGRFDPACHGQAYDRDSPRPSDDPRLDTLAVVGDHPALEIELPRAMSGGGEPGQPPIAVAVRIPGGLLVNVRSPDTGWFPGGFVAAVDLDGEVRWVRCTADALAGPIVAPLETEPDRGLVGTWRWNDETKSWAYSWDVVSLADGITIESFDDFVAAAGAKGAAAANRSPMLVERGVAVFGSETGHVLDANVDGLLRLDLATWRVTTTTVPPEFDGHPAGELELALGTDGSLLRMGRLLDSNLRVPQSVEVNGEWLTDEALRRSVWGPVVEMSYGADGVRLRSWDATGVVRWSSDIRLPNREGFLYGRDGEMVMAVACGPPDEPGFCTDERLVGLDAQTGRELWSVPGWRVVGPMAGGIAYVTDSADLMSGEDPTGWFVLDTRTGRLAESPSWPGVDTFRTGCCGESDYLHAGAHGGIVVAVSAQTMRVWFPADLTPATTTRVTLD
ncbi:MAG: hypothetical protein AB7L17_14040 [Ilumatobacteraceae bacterium]